MPRRSHHSLSKRSVDALEIQDRDYAVWDRNLIGFGVRVLKSGRKVYIVQARGPAGSKRRTLGPHGELTAAVARQRAAEVIRRIRRGRDPVSTRPCEKLSVAALAARYLAAHASVNCKASTLALYRGVIDNHIVPALGERKIADVKHADVAALHYSLHDRPGVANCTLQVLSQMFHRAERWGLISPGASPCRSHRKYRLRARERFLTPGEYRRLGMVLKEGEADGSFSEPAVAALRLLILTGCRRDEILTLRWDDVDFTAGELRLRDSKTGPRMVSLTSAVETVLKNIPRQPGNPWVIVGQRPGRRLMTLKSTWRRVRRKASLGAMRLHDLRHSYASRALAVGENLTMIGKLLNHAQMATTARYAHLMAEAERAAAARVGGAIESAMQAAGHAGSRPRRRPAMQAAGHAGSRPCRRPAMRAARPCGRQTAHNDGNPSRRRAS